MSRRGEGGRRVGVWTSLLSDEERRALATGVRLHPSRPETAAPSDVVLSIEPEPIPRELSITAASDKVIYLAAAGFPTSAAHDFTTEHAAPISIGVWAALNVLGGSVYWGSGFVTSIVNMVYTWIGGQSQPPHPPGNGTNPIYPSHPPEPAGNGSNPVFPSPPPQFSLPNAVRFLLTNGAGLSDGAYNPDQARSQTDEATAFSNALGVFGILLIGVGCYYLYLRLKRAPTMPLKYLPRNYLHQLVGFAPPLDQATNHELAVYVNALASNKPEAEALKKSITAFVSSIKTGGYARVSDTDERLWRSLPREVYERFYFPGLVRERHDRTYEAIAATLLSFFYTYFETRNLNQIAAAIPATPAVDDDISAIESGRRPLRIHSTRTTVRLPGRTSAAAPESSTTARASVAREHDALSIELNLESGALDEATLAHITDPLNRAMEEINRLIPSLVPEAGTGVGAASRVPTFTGIVPPSLTELSTLLAGINAEFPSFKGRVALATGFEPGRSRASSLIAPFPGLTATASAGHSTVSAAATSTVSRAADLWFDDWVKTTDAFIIGLRPIKGRTIYAQLIEELEKSPDNEASMGFADYLRKDASLDHQQLMKMFQLKLGAFNSSKRNEYITRSFRMETAAEVSHELAGGKAGASAHGATSNADALQLATILEEYRTALQAMDAELGHALGELDLRLDALTHEFPRIDANFQRLLTHYKDFIAEHYVGDLRKIIASLEELSGALVSGQTRDAAEISHVRESLQTQQSILQSELFAFRALQSGIQGLWSNLQTQLQRLDRNDVLLKTAIVELTAQANEQLASLQRQLGSLRADQAVLRARANRSSAATVVATHRERSLSLGAVPEEAPPPSPVPAAQEAFSLSKPINWFYHCGLVFRQTMDQGRNLAAARTDQRVRAFNFLWKDGQFKHRAFDDEKRKFLWGFFGYWVRSNGADVGKVIKTEGDPKEFARLSLHLDPQALRFKIKARRDDILFLKALDKKQFEEIISLLLSAETPVASVGRSEDYPALALEILGYDTLDLQTQLELLVSLAKRGIAQHVLRDFLDTLIAKVGSLNPAEEFIPAEALVNLLHRLPAESQVYLLSVLTVDSTPPHDPSKAVKTDDLVLAQQAFWGRSFEKGVGSFDRDRTAFFSEFFKSNPHFLSPSDVMKKSCMEALLRPLKDDGLSKARAPYYAHYLRNSMRPSVRTLNPPLTRRFVKILLDEFANKHLDKLEGIPHIEGLDYHAVQSGSITDAILSQLSDTVALSKRNLSLALRVDPAAYLEKACAAGFESAHACAHAIERNLEPEKQRQFFMRHFDQPIIVINSEGQVISAPEEDERPTGGTPLFVYSSGHDYGFYSINRRFQGHPVQENILTPLRQSKTRRARAAHHFLKELLKELTQEETQAILLEILSPDQAMDAQARRMAVAAWAASALSVFDPMSSVGTDASEKAKKSLALMSFLLAELRKSPTQILLHSDSAAPASFLGVLSGVRTLGEGFFHEPLIWLASLAKLVQPTSTNLLVRDRTEFKTQLMEYVNADIIRSRNQSKLAKHVLLFGVKDFADFWSDFLRSNNATSRSPSLLVLTATVLHAHYSVCHGDSAPNAVQQANCAKQLRDFLKASGLVSAHCTEIEIRAAFGELKTSFGRCFISEASVNEVLQASLSGLAPLATTPVSNPLHASAAAARHTPANPATMAFARSEDLARSLRLRAAPGARADTKDGPWGGVGPKTDYGSMANRAVARGAPGTKATKLSHEEAVALVKAEALRKGADLHRAREASAAGLVATAGADESKGVASGARIPRLKLKVKVVNPKDVILGLRGTEASEELSPDERDDSTDKEDSSSESGTRGRGLAGGAVPLIARKRGAKKASRGRGSSRGRSVAGHLPEGPDSPDVPDTPPAGSARTRLIPRAASHSARAARYRVDSADRLDAPSAESARSGLRHAGASGLPKASARRRALSAEGTNSPDVPDAFLDALLADAPIEEAPITAAEVEAAYATRFGVPDDGTGHGPIATVSASGVRGAATALSPSARRRVAVRGGQIATPGASGATPIFRSPLREAEELRPVELATPAKATQVIVSGADVSDRVLVNPSSGVAAPSGRRTTRAPSPGSARAKTIAHGGAAVSNPLHPSHGVVTSPASLGVGSGVASPRSVSDAAAAEWAPGSSAKKPGATRGLFGLLGAVVGAALERVGFYSAEAPGDEERVVVAPPPGYVAIAGEASAADAADVGDGTTVVANAMTVANALSVTGGRARALAARSVADGRGVGARVKLVSPNPLAAVARSPATAGLARGAAVAAREGADHTAITVDAPAALAQLMPTSFPAPPAGLAPGALVRLATSFPAAPAGRAPGAPAQLATTFPAPPASLAPEAPPLLATSFPAAPASHAPGAPVQLATTFPAPPASHAPGAPLPLPTSFPAAPSGPAPGRLGSRVPPPKIPPPALPAAGAAWGAGKSTIWGSKAVGSTALPPAPVTAPPPAPASVNPLVAATAAAGSRSDLAEIAKGTVASRKLSFSGGSASSKANPLAALPAASRDVLRARDSLAGADASTVNPTRAAVAASSTAEGVVVRQQRLVRGPAASLLGTSSPARVRLALARGGRAVGVGESAAPAPLSAARTATGLFPSDDGMAAVAAAAELPGAISPRHVALPVTASVAPGTGASEQVLGGTEAARLSFRASLPRMPELSFRNLGVGAPAPTPAPAPASSPGLGRPAS